MAKRQAALKLAEDAVIDAVGFEAKGSVVETAMTNLKLEGSSGQALRHCIASVRRGGTVSVPGVYAGFIHGFLFGDIFEKGLTIKTGQTHVQKYLPALLQLILDGKIDTTDLISHRLPLEQAPEAYKNFHDNPNEWTKVVLTPHG